MESWALWGGGLLIWVALIACSMPIARMLHVNAWLMVIFGFEVVPTLALAANIGILQRARWYLWVGLITVLVSGFRVIAASLAAWMHLYPLFSVGVLEGVAAVVAFMVSRRLARRAPALREPSRADVISGTAVVGVINVLLSISDGLLAKHSLSLVTAGRYNGLATIGHTVQFISASFGTVMLTSIIADRKRRYHYLGTTLMMYGGIAGAAEALFLVQGRWVVHTILGSHFIMVATWLPYYGCGMIALGLINIAMLYSVAMSRWEVIATTGLGLMIWIYRLLYSHSLGAFVHATTDTMVGVLVATVIVMGLTERKIRTRAKPGLGP